MIGRSLYAQEFYISTNGNDKNKGTIKSPFASLEQAQAAALKFTDKTVSIYILEGTYYLNKPLVFSSNKVHVSAYAKQQVILKGSKKIDLTWKLYKNGIYKANFPEGLHCDQLYINDQPQVMARYPNYKKGVRPYGGTAEDAIADDRVRNWKNPSGGFIHAMHNGQWGDFIYEITGKDSSGKLVMKGGWQNNRPSSMHKQYRYVENIFEELDTIGEWYLDKKKNVIYYKSEPGIDLSKAIVEIPQLKELISIKGTKDSPVADVNFSGITFMHTRKTFMESYEPLLRSDWKFYRGAAFLFENTSSCRISNCTFSELGGNAVLFSNFNRFSSVDSSHIYNIGASAVCFVGSASAVKSPSFQYSEFVPFGEMDMTKGPKTDDFPTNCSAMDNLIHDIGFFEKQVAGVQISMAQNINILHNTIYNVPRAGINIGDGTWGGHDIGYNDVFDTVLETGDHGAFNSWGRDRYWHPKRATLDTIVEKHRNLILLDAIATTKIHHNSFRCDYGWDIDLDDGSSNYRIFNNVCLNGGLKIREGFFRNIENNIILNNSLHSNVYFNKSHDSFKFNIISSAYLPLRKNDWEDSFDYNLFPDETSLVSVQKNNSDMRSTFGDPLFTDADQGDYRVLKTSPALQVGFQNFNMEFGTRLSRHRKIAKKVDLPRLIPYKTDDNQQTYDFIGATVKDLNTLSERSATGMYEETGVLIISILNTSILIGQLNSNDVILEYAGRPIKNVKDLYYAKSMNQYKKSVPVVIYRDQAKLNLALKLK